MPSETARGDGVGPILFPRRAVLRGGLGAAVAVATGPARAADEVSIGVNPLFLDSDIQLLASLRDYLAQRLGRPVQLVKRRTYQEITAMLLSGQLDAAWICDCPYVQNQDRLSLLATPIFRGEPHYQTYVAVGPRAEANSFDDIGGTVHAFSDPDSTSGYLVTRYLLAVKRTTPAQFFRASFFTYGHRNVVRAVASGLAESGSIDGYVYDVLAVREPGLVAPVRVVYKSEKLGFPPIVGLKSAGDQKLQQAIARAFLDMAATPSGRQLLATLNLDGFTASEPELYRGTLEKWLVVKAQS